jgi:hypothetical protein
MQSAVRVTVLLDTDTFFKWKVIAEDNAGNTVVSKRAPDTFLKRAIQGGELNIDTVAAPVDTVSQGQSGETVVVQITNTGDSVVEDITGLSLRFEDTTGSDVSGDYVSTLTDSDISNGRLAVSETVFSTFSVDVQSDARADTINIEAEVSGRTISDTALNAQKEVSDQDADNSDTWLVQEPAAVMVTSITTRPDSHVLQDGDTGISSDTIRVEVILKNTGEAKGEVSPDTSDFLIYNQVGDTVTSFFVFDTSGKLVVKGGETRSYTYSGTLPEKTIGEVLGPDTITIQDSRPEAFDVNSGEFVAAPVDKDETDTMYRPSETEDFEVTSPEGRVRAEIPGLADTFTDFTTLLNPSNNAPEGSCTIKEANEKVKQNPDMKAPESLNDEIHRIISIPKLINTPGIKLRLHYDAGDWPKPDELRNFVLVEDASKYKGDSKFFDRIDDCSWVPVEKLNNQTVNEKDNEILSRTSGFSIFRVLVVITARDDLSQLKVGPNPFRPNDGQDRTGMSFGKGPESGIHFTNLTESVTIKIYTINGSLVRKLSSSSTRGEIQWDARNKQGTKVASGVYLYTVKSHDTGETKTGKLAIVR